MNQVNNGIQISGGHVQGAMAVGPNASAVQFVGGERAGALLTHIRDLLDQHRGELGEVEPMLDTLTRIETELAGGRPERARLMPALDRLAIRVAPIASLAEALAALTALLTG